MHDRSGITRNFPWNINIMWISTVLGFNATLQCLEKLEENETIEEVRICAGDVNLTTPEEVMQCVTNAGLFGDVFFLPKAPLRKWLLSVSTSEIASWSLEESIKFINRGMHASKMCVLATFLMISKICWNGQIYSGLFSCRWLVK